MKWDKTAIISVIAIAAVFYLYSAFKSAQLSSHVEDEMLAACAEKGIEDCDLVSQYHDECFAASYRAEYRIKEFRRGEYNKCIWSKVEQHINPAKR